MKTDKRLIEKQKVAENMMAYGGSFVRALARALSFADDINAEKIKNAFPDYWDKYLNMGVKQCKN